MAPDPWARRRRRLAVVAPGDLATETAALLAREGDAEVRVVERPAPDGPRGDPFRLRELLRGVTVDAAVLVAPSRRGPRNLTPGPTVHGAPVAIVLADRTDDVRALAAPAPATGVDRVAVCAMAKDRYLDRAGAWIKTLSSLDGDVLDLRADRVDRSGMCEALAGGPALVVYVGHGRARGWAGYQALRWGHVAAPPLRAAAGLVLAVSCGTLARTRNVTPFGVRWVASGRARAYLGACRPVAADAALALADRLVSRLARGADADVASFVAGVTAELADVDAPSERRAWAAFRLIGRPDCALVAGPVAVASGRRDRAVVAGSPVLGTRRSAHA